MNGNGRRSVRLVSSASGRGSALVELALSLPILVIILMGTVDFGRVFYTAMAVNNAARTAALYGSRLEGSSTDTATIETQANNMWVAEFGGSAGFTKLAYCRPMCAPDAPTGSYALSSATGDCSSATCATGHLVKLVTVSAQKAFSTISRYPGIPHTLTITRAFTMRAK
jgi:Flp pilus assembly protein TadG